jgi:pyruvate-ferredoxin/flavodoxin oxidoreductase
VAARSLAAQGLSIFGDHSDVMAVRQTGFALLASASVQEAHDLALVAHAATLATRVPFVHFFDGFRTSHELNTIELLSDDDLRAWSPSNWSARTAAGGLSPERPFIRGTAQNPDVYFQARETVNPFYARIPGWCRPRWTSSASAPAATTGWSTTADTPKPSACWW